MFWLWHMCFSDVWLRHCKMVRISQRPVIRPIIINTLLKNWTKKEHKKNKKNNKNRKQKEEEEGIPYHILSHIISHYPILTHILSHIISPGKATTNPSNSLQVAFHHTWKIALVEPPALVPTMQWFENNEKPPKSRSFKNWIHMINDQLFGWFLKWGYP